MTSAIYPSLRGRHVVITGGATGIGAGLVKAFAAQGAVVSFLDVAEAEGRDLAAALSRSEVAPAFFRCDLKDIGALRTTFAQIEKRFGPVDVLVNNAANDDRHAIEDVTAEYWDERIAVNLRHFYFAIQAVLPGMKARARGSIVNFGSVSWHLGLPALSIYETAKAGIEGMTRALARDLGVHGIRVNCVIPGAVRTPRQTRLWHTPEAETKIVDAQSLKGRIEPEHVAALVLFLASDDAAMCTAQPFIVDAGWA